MKKILTAVLQKCMFLFLLCGSFCLGAAAQQSSRSISSSINSANLNMGWLWIIIGAAVSLSLIISFIKKKESRNESDEKFFGESGIFDVE